MGMGARIAGAVVAFWLSSCGGDKVFACSDDSSCPDGQCELNGYCSFPAEDCPSGRRYGQFSGPFSGQCVAPEDAATSGPATNGDGSGSTSGSTSASTTGPTSASTSGPGDSTTDDTADTGPSPACVAGLSCFEIPDEWLGPVNLFTTEQSCNNVVAQGAQSYAGDWSCACSCEADGLDSCDGVPVQLQLFEQNNCQGTASLTIELTESCQEFGDGELFSVLTTAQGVTACDSDATLDADAVVPSGSRVLCDAFEGTMCTGGVCTSQEAGLCIHAEGERECPDGFERTLLYDGFDDGRGCAACDCEAEYECGGTLTLANNGCGNAGSLTLPLGCTNFLTSVLGGEVGSYTEPPIVDCSSSGGAPTGEIQPSQPRTVCCSP